jgi:hypothetical protein
MLLLSHDADGAPWASSRRLHETSRLDALLERERPTPDRLQTAQTNIAASSAHLPITPEMAWSVPQLLKRVQLVAPGMLSTSGVLRALIRMQQWDAAFANAFADSGFLSCDQVIEKVRWKYDIAAMVARHQDGADFEVLEHCRRVLQGHRARLSLDWEAVLLELRTLNAWFPHLRTIQLLRQLYARLHVLHAKEVVTAQSWLQWRYEVAEDGSNAAIPAWRAAGTAGQAPSERE